MITNREVEKKYCKFCKKELKNPKMSQRYCNEDCRIKNHNKKHKKDLIKYIIEKLNKKCSFKDCSHISCSLFERKFYCDAHYKQLRKISLATRRKEDREKKLKRRKK